MQRSEALIVATTLDDVPISPADCDTDNEWPLPKDKLCTIMLCTGPPDNEMEIN